MMYDDSMIKVVSTREGTEKMAFVILEPCGPEKAAECVSVCPVDCIEEGADQFYIDPDICIDCGA
jgi:NAD-dependent dihydropyrimidine dehydrogenase PreA subunit